jgi:hydroxymethylpyrimidine/phosphomethylpyrimidine kinase
MGDAVIPEGPQSWPVALTIAGSDPSGGAGIQADLKTFAAHEVYGASVITAVTAQNTRGVSAVHAVPPEVVRAQMDAVYSDFRPAAVKTGMLVTAATVEAVADGMGHWRPPHLVIDPVMAAAAGEPLLEPDALTVLITRLLPLASLVTPNLPEAAALVGAHDRDYRSLIRRVGELGARAVLLKGGHGAGAEVIDLLWTGAEIVEFRRPRLETDCTHGTGCTLAAALAAELARGRSLPEAARLAGDYLHRALETARPLEGGRGPLHHFHPFWGRS